MTAITRTAAIAIPAIAPPPSPELPLPLFCDAAVGSLPSDDCGADAPSLLSVLEIGELAIELGGTSSEATEEAVDPVSDGRGVSEGVKVLMTVTTSGIPP